MAKTTFAYITLIVGIAGVILPIIPGLLLIVFALKLLRDSESGRRLIAKLRSYRLIDMIATRVAALIGLSPSRNAN